MDDPILSRILRDHPIDGDAIEWLASRLSAADLQTVLLEVARRRAGARDPAALLQQYRTSRFVRASAIDARDFATFDAFAFSCLPAGFERIELAPVAPLGSCASMTTVHQHKVVSTVRNSEVVSDSTNVMALESAVRIQTARRSGRPIDRVRLASSHRFLRAQRFDAPEFTAHFRVFALTTAGRDEGSFAFEVSALREHVEAYVAILSGAAAHGWPIADVEVAFTGLATGLREEALEALAAELGAEHPEIRFGLDPKRERGRSYYRDACFQVRASNPAGERFEIVDGGFTDWTARLIEDRKQRLLISGLGTELVLALFRRAP